MACSQTNMTLEKHMFKMLAAQGTKQREYITFQMFVQAVVRGRKLRQQLICARQAATYTDEAAQQDAHDSDLDMDQMDDFLASLPDDEAPPPLRQALPSTLASTSVPARSPLLASMPYRCHLSHSAHTGQGSSQPAFDVQSMQAGSSQQLETRRDSHARATTSSIPPASSLDTSLPALRPQSNSSNLTASTAHLAVGSSTPLGRKQVQQQQQQQQQQQPPGFHLPAIPPPIPQSTAPSRNSSFSLPPVVPSLTDVSSTHTMGITEPSVEAGEAAAAAAGDGLRVGGDGSARVSRASSSVRSEQSVGSLSPDRAAAKERRHKVKRLFCSIQLMFWASQEQTRVTTRWHLPCCLDLAVAACISNA